MSDVVSLHLLKTLTFLRRAYFAPAIMRRPPPLQAGPGVA
jgi:hypothetical protein